MRIAAAAAFAALMASLPAEALDGNAARGADLWRMCMSCHQVGPEARNGVGPHLNGLVGRPAAAVEDYKYSDPLSRAAANGLVWDRASLDAYLEDPRSLVTGTRMAFRGIDDPQKRADLITYLREFGDNPRDIPEAAATADPRNPDLDEAILAIEGDTAYGEYLASECVACHQASGADEGIPSITGWPQRDFVIALHAYKQKLRPNPAMQLVAGALSDEEIAALAAYFEGVE